MVHLLFRRLLAQLLKLPSIKSIAAQFIIQGNLSEITSEETWTPASAVIPNTLAMYRRTVSSTYSAFIAQP
jgi:hypothetical protein